MIWKKCNWLIVFILLVFWDILSKWCVSQSVHIFFPFVPIESLAVALVFSYVGDSSLSWRFRLTQLFISFSKKRFLTLQPSENHSRSEIDDCTSCRIYFTDKISSSANADTFSAKELAYFCSLGVFNSVTKQVSSSFRILRSELFLN